MSESLCKMSDRRALQETVRGAEEGIEMLNTIYKSQFFVEVLMFSHN